ncbi:hypothetical protein ABZ624_43035, partial [Streptomyces sp. NPDC007205]
ENTTATSSLTSRTPHQRRPSPLVTTDYGPEPEKRLVPHLGRREHMSDIVQAVAGLLSHQQIADLTSARQM